MPDVVNVSVTLASDVTTTSRVTVKNGGYLSVFAPDGSSYTLQVPPKAVLSDLDMTMTLVASISGSPLGEELVGAVELGPSGLWLLQPAMLTISPATPLPVAAEGPFSADSSGANFHLTPLMPDPSTLTMPLLHFSIFGLFKTDQERRAGMIRKTAADVEAQMGQEVSKAIQDARESGGNQGPAVGERLTYYGERVVRPMMALAEHDHTLFREALRKWTSWLRQYEMYGVMVNPDLEAEIAASFLRAFDNYVRHTIDRCYAHDFGAIIDFMRLFKQDQLQGGELGLEQSGATQLMDKCVTFTLEMDSQVDAHVKTCLLIDAGQSDVTASSHVKARVEIPMPVAVPPPPPWTGPMEWISATSNAKCRLVTNGPQGQSVLEGNWQFAGYADPGVFTVLDFNFDLNPIVSGGEETTAILRVNGIVVQPGDPQITIKGNMSAWGMSIGTDAAPISSGWLAGWTGTADARVQTDLGEGWLLKNWTPTGAGDEIARWEYQKTETTSLSTESSHTTFVLRHTPKP